MEWNDPTGLPAPLTPAPAPLAPAAQPAADPAPAVQHTRNPGLRRTVLTASLAALLYMGGAVAVVSAASPAPAASSAPSTTDPSQPATPPANGPHHGGAAGTKADCPN